MDRLGTARASLGPVARTTKGGKDSARIVFFRLQRDGQAFRPESKIVKCLLMRSHSIGQRSVVYQWGDLSAFTALVRGNFI